MPAKTIETLAAKSLTIAKIHAEDLDTVRQTEDRLDKDLRRESRVPPYGRIQRIRFYGERFLHSKHVLLIVVILNVLDCLLVMGELIFDIFYIVRILQDEHSRDDKFLDIMRTRYPTDLQGVEDMSLMFYELVQATIQWRSHNTSSPQPIRGLLRIRREAVDITNYSNTSFDTYKGGRVEEDIAHGFHKASITILGILFLENVFKVFCLGKHMLDHKLEVFDSIIVVASFTLDLVFIKGITIYLIEDFVVILACLVPWRILRVVNSLVIAIIDHEHFRMKLLYIQKKHVSAQAKAMKAELKLYEESLLALEGLCKSKGITDDTLREHTGDLKNRKKNMTSSNSSQSVAFENSVVSMDSKP